jgi:hypothetical protein
VEAAGGRPAPVADGGLIDQAKLDAMDPMNLHALYDSKELAIEAPPSKNNNENINNTLLAFPDNKNKYFAEFKDGMTLTYKFKTPVKIIGYGFRTANDMPQRDPASWQLSDGQTTLDQRDESGAQNDRFQKKAYAIKPVTVKQIQFVINSNLGA